MDNFGIVFALIGAAPAVRIKLVVNAEKAGDIPKVL